MTDTERLNLIEHYGWRIAFQGGYTIVTGKDDIFVRTGLSIREAIDAALKAQFEWSVDK